MGLVVVLFPSSLLRVPLLPFSSLPFLLLFLFLLPKFNLNKDDTLPDFLLIRLPISPIPNDRSTSLFKTSQCTSHQGHFLTLLGCFRVASFSRSEFVYSSSFCHFVKVLSSHPFCCCFWQTERKREGRGPNLGLPQSISLNGHPLLYSLFFSSISVTEGRYLLESIPSLFKIETYL